MNKANGLKERREMTVRPFAFFSPERQAELMAIALRAASVGSCAPPARRDNYFFVPSPSRQDLPSGGRGQKAGNQAPMLAREVLSDGATTAAELRSLSEHCRQNGMRYSASVALGIAKYLQRQAIKVSKQAVASGELQELWRASGLALRAESCEAIRLLAQYCEKSGSGDVKHALKDAWYANYAGEHGQPFIVVRVFDPSAYGGHSC